MNESIINGINWNVGQDDILICLGDWSFGGFEYIEEFRNRIVCKNVHLVLGNHDHHIERNRGDIRKIFTSVSDYETLIIDKRTFRLFHYPIQSWNGMNNGDIHLHGHVHLPPLMSDFNFIRIELVFTCFFVHEILVSFTNGIFITNCVSEC